MYGMINNALAKMVEDRFGAGTAWDSICHMAGCDEVVFISLEQYPDELTVRLVVATASFAGVSIESLLEEFGAYWVRYAQSTAYGPLLAKFSSLAAILENLNEIHRRIALTLSGLDAPVFRFERDATGGTLAYYSSRDGLGPMVIGLVRGLANLQHTDLQITWIRRRADPADFDQFRLDFAA